MFRDSIADTIIAVSTPRGRGGIGVVRISGPDALSVSLTFFRPSAKLRNVPERRAVFGRVVDPGTGKSFDEAVLLYFRAPRSYTREDVVELSLHGNPILLEEAVRLGIAAGARPAGPGEFTLRACMNGRYDLVQAEAVNDLIRAESGAAAMLAWSQVNGRLSARILEIRRGLIELLAGLEASIEFPDEGLGDPKTAILCRTAALISGLETLLSTGAAGKAVLEGAGIAIVGRANVGKSTLFNAFLGKERAIVAPEAGTTRDYLTERLVIRGQGFNLIDMAGFGRASSAVEKEGVRRSRKIADRADGLLILLDASKPIRNDDVDLLEEYRDRKALLVFNKIDLPVKMDIRGIQKTFPRFPAVKVSALKSLNISRLLDKIHRLFSPIIPDSGEVVLHERQLDLLQAALERLRAAEKSLGEGLSEELAAEEIRQAIPLIGRLTGEIGAEEVIGDIFGRFCVGK